MTVSGGNLPARELHTEADVLAFCASLGYAIATRVRAMVSRNG